MVRRKTLLTFISSISKLSTGYNMQILVFYGVILWVITEVLLHNER